MIANILIFALILMLSTTTNARAPLTDILPTLGRNQYSQMLKAHTTMQLLCEGAQTVIECAGLKFCRPEVGGKCVAQPPSQLSKLMDTITDLCEGKTTKETCNAEAGVCEWNTVFESCAVTTEYNNNDMKKKVKRHRKNIKKAQGKPLSKEEEQLSDEVIPQNPDHDRFREERNMLNKAREEIKTALRSREQRISEEKK